LSIRNNKKSSNEKSVRNGASRSQQIALIILLSLGFALNLTPNLLARSSIASPDDIFSFGFYVRSIAFIATFFIVAYLGRKNLISAPRLIIIATFCKAGYLGYRYSLPLFLTPGQQSGFFLASGAVQVLNGIAGALLILLFLYLISLFPTKYFGVALPLAIAGSHAMLLLSGFIPENLIFWMPPLCYFLALVLMILCYGKIRLLSEADVVNQKLPDPSGKEPSIPESMSELKLVLSSVMLFPFLAIFVAETSTLALPASGLFDLSAEIIGISALLLLAAIMLVFINRIKDIRIAFIVIFLIITTATLLLPAFWESEFFVSGLMMKCGFLLYNALFWIFLAQQTSLHRNMAYLFFGIANGMMYLVTLLGRIIGHISFKYFWMDSASVVTISLLALWALAISLLIFFLRFYRHRNEQLSTVREVSRETEYTEFLTQCQGFSKAHGLSEREFEVLVEFSRGRSVDYIAKELYLSRDTVKTYVKRIYSKGGIHNRQELIDAIERI